MELAKGETICFVMGDAVTYLVLRSIWRYRGVAPSEYVETPHMSDLPS